MTSQMEICPMCGEQVPINAVKCKHCDSALSTTSDSEKTESPSTNSGLNNTEPPALWNPSAIAGWSVLFTPVFGSILLRKNWKALGNQSEAKKSLVWLIISAVLIALIVLNKLPMLGAVTLLVLWYFLQAKKQIKYVRELGDYPVKTWKFPVGISAVALLIALMINSSTGIMTIEDLHGTWKVDIEELLDREAEKLDREPTETQRQLARAEQENKLGETRYIFTGNTLSEYKGSKGYPIKVLEQGKGYIVIKYGDERVKFVKNWNGMDMIFGRIIVQNYPLVRE